ncbi:MAG TPA: LytTR family DNA-binding domain-containing protein [Puia sp.]|jgi:DNA-binding LytR/AlgR family response regulator|nr:LytTR family DNA-binding domain-containing protein [Puia sp.]
MNILIIEDEPRTARLLKEFILAVDDSHTVLGICDSVESTVHFLQTTTQRIDLLFMDIQLADGNSFDIFQKVPITSPVIFCTAYEDHLLEAFKSNGIDYVLKPFHEKDIEQAFRKLDQLRSSLLLAPTLPARIQQALANRTQSSFLVKFREKMYPVAVRDIAAVALEKEVVYLYTFDKDKHAVFRPIDDIESALDPQNFFRINRQMILNRDAILEMEPFFNRRVIVTLKVPTAERPLVSRLKVPPFLEWIEKG